LLLPAYLLTAGGLQLRLHYCMGQFAGLYLGAASHAEGCTKCGMKTTKKGCCDDKAIVLQTAKSYHPSCISLPAACNTGMVVSRPLCYLQTPLITRQQPAPYIDTSPLISRTNYLQLCVLLI